MKKLSLLLPFILCTAAFSPVAEAKDKKKDKHEDFDSKRYEARNEVRNLQVYLRQVQDRVARLGGSRRDLGELQQIGAEANRLADRVESGDFDRQRLAERCNQLHDAAMNLQVEVERDAKYRGGYQGDDYDRDHKHRRH